MPSTVYSLGGALCGIVLAHVDDFQIGGGRSNHNFKTTLDHLKGLYKWGKWVDDANGYKVSGINVQRTQDRGFHLDMEGYTKSVRADDASSRITDLADPRDAARIQGEGPGTCQPTGSLDTHLRIDRNHDSPTTPSELRRMA
jgi:hypothetical protein